MIELQYDTESGLLVKNTNKDEEFLVALSDNLEKVYQALSLDDDGSKINETVIHDKADIDPKINWTDSAGIPVTTYKKSTDTVNTSGKDATSTISTYTNALKKKK